MSFGLWCINLSSKYEGTNIVITDHKFVSFTRLTTNGEG